MNRRRSGSLASSPLLIGAITTLIVVVAVYLSYNANNGLPFVPTYNIKVVLPQTSGLSRQTSCAWAVRAWGSSRSCRPIRTPPPDRSRRSRNLKLEKKVEPLPVDTTASVQSLSLDRAEVPAAGKGSSRSGRSSRAARSRSSQVREPVNIEDLFNMFDAKTRTANQVQLNNFGDGLAGRGLGLNNTIATLRPLLTNAIPVSQPGAPATGLHELWIALDRVSSQAAPVAAPGRRCMWSSTNSSPPGPSVASRRSNGRPCSGRRRSNRRSTRSPTRRKFTENSTEFMHLLRPSASLLISVAPPLGHAVTVGAVNLNAATALNQQLASSARGAEGLRREPDRPRRPRRLHPDACSSATRCSPGSRPSRPTATTSRWRSATSRA